MTSILVLYKVRFSYQKHHLTKLTASVKFSSGGPGLKNGFLPISMSCSDKKDDSVQISEKISDVRSIWSPEKLLVSDVLNRSSWSDDSNDRFMLCVFMLHQPMPFIAV